MAADAHGTGMLWHNRRSDSAEEEYRRIIIAKCDQLASMLPRRVSTTSAAQQHLPQLG